MNQIVKDKMQREIMVVKNKFIFWESEKESKFYDSLSFDFEKHILENYEYMIRWLAEVNFEYKQPIWYWIVINDIDEVFVYKRWWAWSNAWESRLHNKIAIWVWWHIEKEDKDLTNPISDSLVREIEEELNIKPEDVKSVEAIWYINNETDEVSKVHIWIAYIVRVHNSNIELLDWELDNWEFVSIHELESMIASWEYDVEAWSKIVFDAVKKYLVK